LPFSRPRDLRAHERELILGAIAAVEAAVALAIPLTSDSLAHPYEFALMIAWSILAFTFAGLLWWRARPGSRTARLLCVLGLSMGLQAFQGSDSSAAYTLGVVADAPIGLTAWYLIAAYPAGRLNAWGRVVMGIAAGAIVFGFLPWLLFSTEVTGATPLARCLGECPANAFLIADEPTIAAAFRHVEEWGLVAFSALLVGTLVVRLVRAGPPLRRILAPVYLASGLWVLAFWAYHAAQRVGISEAGSDALALAVTVTRSLFPIGCIAAIVLARVYAGARLQPLIRDLMGHSSARSLEELVRKALGDPSARLAFWLPRSRRYVDAAARDVEAPVAGDGVSWHAFGGADGEPTIAILYDAVLDEDPELVDAAGLATVLAVENRRLERNLRRSTDDLRSSRQRLVSAVTDERRKIEQELHDGSQQRLLSIGIELELVRERGQADAETLARLAELAGQVDEALQELRSVAHGTYPQLLGVLGLEPALRELAGRSGVPVAVELEEVPRFPREVEAAVYFTCLEAVQNVLKHAGRRAQVQLRLAVEDGELRFAVADDGAGFTPSPARPGSGLQNMADRLGAVGGHLSVSSAPAHGTVVSGEIPVGNA
jgi:signal transduction histidine kinase